MQHDASAIKDYHVHVYFDQSTFETAYQVRDGLAERFDVILGRIQKKPVGPHPEWMYQVKFDPDEFGKLLPWLMLNHQGLSVLIHPQTGNDVADHSDNALWLGTKLELNIEFLQKIADKKKNEAKAA